VLNFASQPSPFEWFESFAGYSTFQYQQPPLLATRTFSHRLDRDETMRVCYQRFIHILQISPTLDLYKPTRVPLVAISAAPGCGKSFILDELGALRPEDIAKYCESVEWRTSFENALVLKASFNGWSGVVDSDDRDSLALCSRITFGY
jgi:hypothetical protein